MTLSGDKTPNPLPLDGARVVGRPSGGGDPNLPNLTGEWKAVRLLREVQIGGYQAAANRPQKEDAAMASMEVGGPVLP